MKKRLLSMILALSMMLTFVPMGTVTAFADDIDSSKGTLITITDGKAYTIDQPGTYQMKGTYNAPILVTAAGDVTINITGNVEYVGAFSKYGWLNYAIRPNNSNCYVTINNQNNYTFTSEGAKEARGIIYMHAGHAVVNGGIYHGDKTASTDNRDGKEPFFNLHGATLELNDVQIDAIEAINNRGVLNINGGVFKGGYEDSTGAYPIILNKLGGKATLSNAEFYAEMGDCIWNSFNSVADPSTVTIENSKLVSNSNTEVAIGNNSKLYFKSGTATAPNADAIYIGPKAILTEVTGGTIENSKRGILVCGNETVLKNADFKNNGTDIYLYTDKLITIDENYKENLTVNCVDAKENRQITTASENQKNIKLTSVNDEYLVMVHKNDDGTEYQELVKRIGHFVTADHAVATAEISGEVKTLDDTIQVPENTEVTVKADKAPEGMVFEKWEVSPEGAITDEAFDLTAETATFKMPACDVTVTAKYVTPKPEPKPEPEPEPETYTLKVVGGSFTTGDSKAATSGTVPVNAEAIVTLNKDAVPEGMVFDHWTISGEKSLISNPDVTYNAENFTIPANAVAKGASVTVEAQYRDATIEDDGPNLLGTAAVIGVSVAGAAVLGYQGYMIGTELYLKGALPGWAIIPENRAELALLIWKDAEQPEPVENVLYADIDENDTDTQKAARWAVENDLMELLDEDNNPDHFDPAVPVTRWEVIQTWNKAQELKKV